MGITDKTRKLLWGRSGNLCAVCKNKLIYEATIKDSDSIVSDECHIISTQKNGPRYEANDNYDKDSYDNLILLCKIHHKLIDDQPETFTAEVLKSLKSNHEKLVADRLSRITMETKSETQKRNNPDEIKYMPRLNSGKEILDVVAGVYQFGFLNDELENKDELNLISSFIQEVQDYGEIYSDLESGARIEAAYYLSKRLKEIEAEGFWVFGVRENLQKKIANKSIGIWPTGTINVIRNTNPVIMKFDLNEVFSKNDQ